MAVKSISKNLLKITEKLDIKLSVNILDNQKNNSLYSYFHASHQTSYFIVNMSSFVGMTYKDKGGNWDNNKRIKINNCNIYQLIVGLRKARNNIYHPQLFEYMDDDDIEVNADIAIRQTVNIDNLLDGQCIKIIPSVIYDTDDKAMVGVMLYINNSDYCVDLSVDEFETLVYFFEQLNIGTETQMVVNMFLLEQTGQAINTLVNGKPGDIPKPNNQTIQRDNTKRMVLFKDDKEKKETGILGPINSMKKKVPKTLDDL